MRARNKGFTLLEVMVVVAIVAIAGAIAIPGFFGSMKRQAVRNEARQLISSLREARSLAIARTSVPNLVCPGGGGSGSGGGPGCLPRTMGVRVTSRTTYEIFGDADNVDGGDEIIQRIDLRSRGGDARVEIDEADIPFTLRFATNGVLTGSAPNGRDIAVIDTVTNERHVVRITAAGFATLDVN
jgi:prepilin-type N-terminal cleavage/methylation domain-containing protein